MCACIYRSSRLSIFLACWSFQQCHPVHIFQVEETEHEHAEQKSRTIKMMYDYEIERCTLNYLNLNLNSIGFYACASNCAFSQHSSGFLTKLLGYLQRSTYSLYYQLNALLHSADCDAILLISTLFRRQCCRADFSSSRYIISSVYGWYASEHHLNSVIYEHYFWRE